MPIFSSLINSCRHFFDGLNVYTSSNEKGLSTMERKVIQAEAIIFHHSDYHYSHEEIKKRVDEVVALKINYDLINPANRDSSRHPRQWFIDLLALSTLERRNPDSPTSHGPGNGEIASNYLNMAAGLLPYIGPVPNLKLDNQEYTPPLDYEKKWFKYEYEEGTDAHSFLPIPHINNWHNVISIVNFTVILKNFATNPASAFTKEMADKIINVFINNKEKWFLDYELSEVFKLVMSNSPDFISDKINVRYLEKCPNALKILTDNTLEVKIKKEKENLLNVISNPIDDTQKSSNIKKNKV